MKQACRVYPLALHQDAENIRFQKKYTFVFPQDVQRLLYFGSREEHCSENGVTGHVRYVHDAFCFNPQRHWSCEQCRKASAHAA
eukprot:1153813-Pelagomonas_calceolata.AAC.3